MNMAAAPPAPAAPPALVALPIAPPPVVAEGFWASKTRLQKGFITAFVVVALAFLWGMTSDGVGEKIRALVIDPNTHATTVASGAIFYGVALTTALGIWALLDNKENRLFNCLFENKDSYQTTILVGAAVIMLLAMPFILLAAQGCEPFKEGWDQFQNYVNMPTPGFQEAFPATLIALSMGVIASQVVSSLIKNKDSFPWWDNKSASQQKALYTMGVVAIIASIFILLTVKGVSALDNGWENFKGLITDKSSDLLHALPALGILMGLVGVTGVSLWNLLANKETHRNMKIRWAGSENVGRVRMVKLLGLLFVAALAFTILNYKGVDGVVKGAQEIRKAFASPAISIAICIGVSLTLVCSVWYAFFPKEKSFAERLLLQEAEEQAQLEKVADARRVQANHEAFIAAQAKEAERQALLASGELRDPYQVDLI